MRPARHSGTCSRSRARSRRWRARVSSSRRTCSARATPTSRSSTARSSRSRSPRSTASACGCSSTTARATPGPARSTRRWWPRRSPKRATTRGSAPRTRRSGCPSRRTWTRRAPDLDLWRDELLAIPTEEKVALALEVEAATRRADPRVRGVESASYGDGAVEVAVASSLGVEASARRTVCSVSSVAMAGEGEETQTGYGFSVGRTVADLDVAPGRSRCGRAVDAPPRRAPTGVAAAAGDPRSARHPLVPRPARRRAQRRGDAQGPVDVRRAAPVRRSRPRT